MTATSTETPTERPQIVEAHVTSFSCPTQWEGTLDDGRTFYFRERHNRARLDIPYGTTVRQVNNLTNDELPIGLEQFVAMFPEVGIAADAKIGTFTDFLDAMIAEEVAEEKPFRHGK